MVDLVTPVLASFAAGAFVEVVQKTIELRRARRKLSAARESEFQQALESDSLEELGQYLDSSLGPFSVAEYVRNDDVRKRVDLFVSRLQDYVREEGDIPARREAPGPVATKATASIPGDSEFALVKSKFSVGASWDALATLRRLIEMRLRDFATSRKLPIGERSGAGRLIEILRRHEFISSDAADRLRFSVAVANRAVHGLDVSTRDAEDAIENARSALMGIALVGESPADGKPKPHN